VHFDPVVCLYDVCDTVVNKTLAATFRPVLY
jgi:hypothetical protein